MAVEAAMHDSNLREQDVVCGRSEGTRLEFSGNALAVLNRRYLRKGNDSEPVETVEEMFHRVAGYVADVEKNWGGPVPERELEFYDLLTSLRFLPNSPTFTGAGTPLAQLAACFVLPIADDMGSGPDGIFQTLRDAALIQQTGGGTGFAFSRLRPKGAIVHSSGGKATGPVGFLRVYDVASEIISQGGARRGANMAVLRVDHPDIEEFIHCKRSENAIRNFNISVGLTDAFMQAVETDGRVELINPQDGKTWKTVNARAIFDEIVAGAHRNGEPGVLFLDAANRDNPCPHLGQYETTNPCGEQFLLPYECCCLGSVNLARHVSHDAGGVASIDWAELESTVRLGMRFLDDVVEANGYVPGVPKLKEAALRTRRVGLGLMGLGDLLYELGVPYGSDEALEAAGQVMEFIRFHAMCASVELARDRGSFPVIKASLYDPDNLAWQPPEPAFPFRHSEKWGRPSLDWGMVTEGIQRHGIRNAAQTTIAPTGTVATVAGCEAYGCEPVYALSYVRLVVDEGSDLELNYASPLFLRALERAGFGEEERKRIAGMVAEAGSCQGIDEVPAAIRRVFRVAGDIPAVQHVRMQAAFQAFVDASISKTINFSAGADPEDLSRAFMLAWRLGCKGLTAYVTGTREKVVLETEATRRAKHQGLEQSPAAESRRPRPRSLDGKTYRILTPLGTAYLTVNRNGSDESFEVFLNVGKAGSDTAAVAEAIGRLISLVLRVPSPLSATRRLKEVVRQMSGIGGGRPMGFGAERVRSLPDAVAQVLAEHLGMVEASSATEAGQLLLFPTGDLCPECGHAALVNEEGCRRCYACGYSEC
jgi:ribonucleoside-diphosphate reductase alpha chain